MGLKYLQRQDQARHSRLVLESDDGKTLRRPGTLARDHRPGDPHALSIGSSLHLVGGQHTHASVCPRK